MQSVILLSFVLVMSIFENPRSILIEIDREKKFDLIDNRYDKNRYSKN